MILPVPLRSQSADSIQVSLAWIFNKAGKVLLTEGSGGKLPFDPVALSYQLALIGEAFEAHDQAPKELFLVYEHIRFFVLYLPDTSIALASPTEAVAQHFRVLARILLRRGFGADVGSR